MTEAALVEVLIDEIDAGNVTYVTELRDAARTAITNGNGVIAPLTSASLNGKSFTRDVKLDPVVVLRCCRQALAYQGHKDVSATSLDFSGLGNGL